MQKNFLKTTQLIHFAMFVSMCIFIGIAYGMNKDRLQFIFPEEGIFQWIVAIAILIAFYMSYFIFKKLLGKIDDKTPLYNKLKIYQMAFISKLAYIEMAAFFCGGITFVTKNSLYPAIAVLITIYFFTLRPSKEKIFSDLKFTPQEEQEFERGYF